MSKETKKFDILLFSYRSIILIVIQYYSFQYGQNFQRTLLWSSFFITIFFISDHSIFGSISYLVFVFLSICELFSWVSTSKPFDSLSFSAINLKFLWSTHPLLIFIGVIGIIIVLLSAYLPIIQKNIEINVSYPALMSNIAIVLGFFLCSSLVIDFEGIFSKTLFNQFSSELKEKIIYLTNTQPTVLQSDNNTLKNLILLQLESHAFEFITKDVMPYMYNLTQQYETIAPIISQPYTTWSTGGTVITQCGIPQLMPSVNMKYRKYSTINYFTKFPCIPDFLTYLNYEKLYTITGSDQIMGFGDYRAGKNYTFIKQTVSDLEMADILVDEILPKIDREFRQNKKRFLAWHCNSDTHLPFKIPKYCTPKKSLNQLFNCFYCFDQIIHRIVDKFFELKMNEHSLLVLFPDHIPYTAEIKDNYNKLFWIFPGVKKSHIDVNQVTYYDFLPTILPMIGIEDYMPKPIFGRNIYDKNAPPHIPNTNDLSLLAYYIQNNIGDAQNAFYYICVDYSTNKKYFSMFPCNQTFQ